MKHHFRLFVGIFLLTLSIIACSSTAKQETQPTKAQPTKTGLTEAALTEEPQLSADEHAKQGRDLFHQGEFEQAADEFLAALELDPTNKNALIGLGQVLIEFGQYTDAISQFDTVLANDPDNQDAKNGLCVAMAFTQPPEGEIRCLAAIELDPKNSDLHNALGIAQVQQGKNEEAIASIQKAIELNPQNDWAHNNLGYIYLHSQNYESAIPELEQAIQIDPEHATAYYNLGRVYFEQSEYQQAIPNYENTIKFDPGFYKAYRDLGLIYQELGETGKAIAMLEKFLGMRPNDPDREQYEAMLTELKGNFVKARIAFVSERDGNPEIYSMNTDGSSLVRLTDNAANDIEPDWSPDGEHIAFASNQNGNFDIYIMKADGTDVIQLTDDPANDFSPVWSPDSKIIAFMSERNGTPSIYLVYADGSELTPLFREDNNTTLTPTFADGPDIQGVAFVTKPPQGTAFDLYYLKSGDGNTVRVTEGLGDVLAPDWAPNGRYIVFSANPSGNQDLFIIRPDGTDFNQLTKTDVDENKPRWSPDSNFIMYTVGRNEAAEIEIRDENGQVVRLTHNDDYDGMATWGPME